MACIHESPGCKVCTYAIDLSRTVDPPINRYLSHFDLRDFSPVVGEHLRSKFINEEETGILELMHCMNIRNSVTQSIIPSGPVVLHYLIASVVSDIIMCPRFGANTKIVIVLPCGHMIERVTELFNNAIDLIDTIERSPQSIRDSTSIVSISDKSYDSLSSIFKTSNVLLYALDCSNQATQVFVNTILEKCEYLRARMFISPEKRTFAYLCNTHKQIIPFLLSSVERKVKSPSRCVIS